MPPKGETTSRPIEKRTEPEVQIEPEVKIQPRRTKLPSLNEEAQLLQQALRGELPKLSDTKKAVEPVSSARKEDNSSKSEPENFSVEELKIAWLQFAEKQKVDEPRMYSLLVTNIPEIIDESVLYFRLANRSQESHFNEIKPRLLNFLRRELGNSAIDFKLEVVETETTENKLYTTKDKFEFLVKKNPALGRMKQQLNLDFD